MKQEFDQFRKLVKTYRENAGLSQEQLAKDAKILPDYYKKIEGGLRSSPSRNIVLRLIGVLAECSELSFQEKTSILESAGFTLLADEVMPSKKIPLIIKKGQCC